MVLEKTLGSDLDCKEIQPVHPRGDQSWVFIGRTDVEAETPTLLSPDVKKLLFFFLIFKLFLFIYFFYFTILYWFCHTSTCIHHECTRLPNPEPPSHIPPYTILLGHPSEPAPSFLYPASNLDWLFVSWMILYMF